MRPLALITVIALLALGCGPAAPTSVPAASSAPSAVAADASPRPPTSELPSLAPGLARLEPADGAYFGLNLDWDHETAKAAGDELGHMPSVWVQFARFPLDDGGRKNLDDFIDQVASVGGIGLITLEPYDGLGAVTAAAATELADLLAGYQTTKGVRTFVRFAHEMNGSWYPWSQQPAAYISAFRRVAAAVHERAPGSAMVWAPNQGWGYPFPSGTFAAKAGSTVIAELDTDGDGHLSPADDPYAPYYPGDDAVDWVGMSLYHWGLAYPWGENEMPPAGSFAAMLGGQADGAHADARKIPDFYKVYVEGHDRPMAIVETAILYDPAATNGPTEADLKTAWFHEVFGPSTRAAFPRIRMLNWFEWRKKESEVRRVIDWRLGSDPALARSLLDAVPGWLIFGGPTP